MIGTLMFHSGSGNRVLGHFLPLHRIAAGGRPTSSRIRRITPLRRPARRRRTTGPGGTTDIEGSLVHGAHEPRFLRVVQVEAAPP